MIDDKNTSEAVGLYSSCATQLGFLFRRHGNRKVRAVPHREKPAMIQVTDALHHDPLTIDQYLNPFSVSISDVLGALQPVRQVVDILLDCLSRSRCSGPGSYNSRRTPNAKAQPIHISSLTMLKIFSGPQW